MTQPIVEDMKVVIKFIANERMAGREVIIVGNGARTYYLLEEYFTTFAPCLLPLEMEGVIRRVMDNKFDEDLKRSPIRRVSHPMDQKAAIRRGRGAANTAVVILVENKEVAQTLAATILVEASNTVLLFR